MRPTVRFVLLWGGGLLLTAAWLVLCAYYVDFYIGWDNLLLLLPHEIGAFFTGAFAPLAFLWLVLLYAHEQGLCSRRLQPEELFPKEVESKFKI